MNNIKTNKGWILHLAIVTAMYGYYLYLWCDHLFFYDGKAGWRGYELFMMTMLTAPAYFAFHVAAFFIARSAKARKVMIVSLAALLILLIHIIAVFA